MNADVLSNCLEQATLLIREAGKLLHDRVCSSSIQEKGKTDFVTAVDTAVQYFIRERLQKLNSSIQFMGEEQDNSSIEPDRLTWILGSGGWYDQSDSRFPSQRHFSGDG